MSAYKVNIREEIVVRQWQQVIDCGIDTGYSIQTNQSGATETTPKAVIFEVMP